MLIDISAEGNYSWYLLTHPRLVSHICVSGQGQHWLGVMVCRLFGAKPLPDSTLTYCQLDPWEQTSMTFESKYKTSSMVMHLKMSSAKMEAILSSEDDLNLKNIVHRDRSKYDKGFTDGYKTESACYKNE